MRRPVRPPCAGSPRSRRVARSDVARPQPPTRPGRVRGRRPPTLEQPVDDEVVEPTATAPLAARDALASESEALGDRAAPRVVRSGPDHDAGQAHLAEPDPDQRPDGARPPPAPPP